MRDKIVSLCGQEQTLSFLRWILENFEKGVQIRQYNTQDKLREGLNSETFDILILDAEVIIKSLFDYLNELHDKRAALKTILIVNATRKDEVLKIIQANLVKGVVVKPFSGEVVCKYLERLL